MRATDGSKNPEQPPTRRHLPHLPPIELSNRTIIAFVTQTVAKRRPLLTRPEAVAALLNAWREAGAWLVGRYVVMPDHLHFFCSPAVFPARPLKTWMQYWPSSVTRAWPWPEEKPLWQRNFFDRQMRRGESYSQKWSYLRNKPVRAGLATQPGAWLWQGELNPLVWNDPA